MRALVGVLGLLTATAATGLAPPLVRSTVTPNLQEEVPYDGRVTFVRIRFGGSDGGLGGGERSFFGRREAPWAHDYPRADRNFMQIVEALTRIHAYPDGSRVLTMDDPEVFKYPLIYVVEVGYWRASDEEIAALGTYLQKGGFLFVDDFRGNQIRQLQYILAQALPQSEILEVPNDHPIFDAFWRIEDPHALIPPYGGQVPYYLGIFEDNDPNGRLMAILNYNNDIAEYWEYSDRGYYPIDLSNEAYQFGVNYFVYALTH